MIDLHLHTTASDGTYTPNQIVEEAQKLGLSIISITDHNSVDAYRNLKSTEIKIISGCEISTTYNGEAIEVLAYGFDIDVMSKLLSENVLTFEQKQIREFELVKKRYKEIGLQFDINNIVYNPKKENFKGAFKKELLRHEENFKFFLEPKSFNGISSFVRNELYNPKSKLYVDCSSLHPSLEETISMIHEAKGLAFLAHPFAYSPTIVDELENLVKIYKLDGLECYHTKFTDENSAYLLDFCNKHSLYKSGGSDFHGENKTNHNIGSGAGNLKINESIIVDWYDA